MISKPVPTSWILRRGINQSEARERLFFELASTNEQGLTYTLTHTHDSVVTSPVRPEE